VVGRGGLEGRRVSQEVARAPHAARAASFAVACTILAFGIGMAAHPSTPRRSRGSGVPPTAIAAVVLLAAAGMIVSAALVALMFF
jgi:hypothetical protein